MTLDSVLKVGNIVAWIVAAVVFYFVNLSSTDATMFKVNERVSVLEHQMKQEALGYTVLQSSIGQRLDRIERKVDCLIDKRLCH